MKRKHLNWGWAKANTKAPRGWLGVPITAVWVRIRWPGLWLEVLVKVRGKVWERIINVPCVSPRPFNPPGLTKSRRPILSYIYEKKTPRRNRRSRR